MAQKPETILIKSKNIRSDSPADKIKCLKCDKIPTIKQDEGNPTILTMACACGRMITFNQSWEFDKVIRPMIASRFYLEEEVEVIYKMQEQTQGTSIYLASVKLTPEETAIYYERQAELDKLKPKKKKKK